MRSVQAVLPMFSFISAIHPSSLLVIWTAFYKPSGSNAAIVAGGGLLSSLIGGVVSDYLANPPEREDGVISRPRARAWIPAVGEQDLSPIPYFSLSHLTHSEFSATKFNLLCIIHSSSCLAISCLAGSLLAAPLWAAFILAEDPAVAAACLLAEYLTAECWFGPTVASIFSVVPKDKRGTVTMPLAND